MPQNTDELRNSGLYVWSGPVVLRVPMRCPMSLSVDTATRACAPSVEPLRLTEVLLSAQPQDELFPQEATAG
jgi:hypothetical protein